MKTTIEIGGFEITVEELEGKVSVKAVDGDGEEVESFELESGSEDTQDDETQDDDSTEFDSDSEEEDSFDDVEDEDETDAQKDEETQHSTLESFSDFFKKKVSSTKPTSAKPATIKRK